MSKAFIHLRIRLSFPHPLSISSLSIIIGGGKSDVEHNACLQALCKFTMLKHFFLAYGSSLFSFSLSPSSLPADDPENFCLFYRYLIYTTRPTAQGAITGESLFNQVFARWEGGGWGGAREKHVYRAKQ